MIEVDKKKQKEAQEKARQLLNHEEEQRVKRRMLKLVAKLESDDDALLNNELMENLPEFIASSCDAGERDRVNLLFEKLGNCSCSEKPIIRERAVMALSLCMVHLQQQEYSDVIEKIIVILLRWLKIENTFLSVCGTVCKQLQEYGIRKLEEGLWDECENLLEVLYQIQAGILEKNNAIKSIVTRSQEAIATEYLLEELTLICLHGRGNRRQKAEKILPLLGRRAAIRLLDTLLASEEKEERLRLIGLIPATGIVAVSVFKEYLQKDLPWYGVRNIILMITAMDNEDLIPLIMPCLHNEDIRIQQQVVDCITEVAVTNQANFLKEALPIVNDGLKAVLVNYIGQLGGSSATECFLDLLAQRDSFSPTVKDKLLQNLAIQIRLSDSKRAVNLLEMILEERKELRKPEDDPVAQVVSQSLQILKPQFDKKDAIEKTEEKADNISVESVSFTGDPVDAYRAEKEIRQINEKVTKLIGQNQLDKATRLLYDRCVEAARDKNFDVAELLRDRILEIDPTSLTEVIKAGEIIEDEQSSSITRSHISVWQDLYDFMSTEEFNTLYHTLENVEYDTGDLIVQQGTNKPILYFVNSGNVRLTYLRGKKEIFLKNAGPGEIIGAEQFFEVSLWTVTLTAHKKSDVQTLDREKFIDLLENYPGLEPCLIDYCLQRLSIADFLKKSGEERREHPRYPIKINLKYTFLDDSGNKTMRNFNGEATDISVGGLTFFIKIARKENARLLLGRKITIALPGAAGKAIECSSRIVAVRKQDLLDNDYSVHVQFNNLLQKAVVKNIINSN